MNKGFPLLIAALLFAGCAQHYDMMLTNGVRVTNITKPVLNSDSGQFTYKDVAGKSHHVMQSRVLEIKPHSSRDEPFTSTPR